MALEKLPDIERQDVLRQFVTFHVKRACADMDPPLVLDDTERARTVDQIVEFWGDTLEDLVVTATDRETADDADPEKA